MLDSLVKEAVGKGSESESHSSKNFVKWFSELSNKDVAIAGGKGASLAEMYNHKFPIPPGFIVTADAYKYFIEKAKLKDQIQTILKETNVDDTSALEKNSVKIKGLIINSEMPVELRRQIIEAYDVLDVEKQNFSKASESALDILRNSHEPPFVAVRSSATTEDLADASFAGQQESFLNVKGNDQLILHVKKTFASLFTPRAIYYRVKKGFFHDNSYLAVVVQKMINSTKSGVIFSKNPLKDDNNIVMEAVWGLGEGIVSGRISPDHYVVTPDLKVIEEKTAEKKIALTRNSSGKTEVINLREEISKREVLTGYEIKILAQYAQRLEEHYGKPQDIEFAIEDTNIYIVQSRPITTQVKKDDREVAGNILLSGLGASPGIASGIVKVVKDLSELNKVQKGNVLVTVMTNPDMVVTMQKASAIITDEGGVTSHAAIVSREMGIPAVVGTKEATTKLQDGQVVTVDGFTGRIIEGHGIEKKIEIKPIVPTKTKIKVIVDLPDYAERAAESGSKAIGLVRLEAAIATSGKHPVWFVRNDKVDDYIKILNEKMRKIAKPFQEVWFRTSDFRSDEYKNLEGAPQKTEGNPMLGNHGIRFSLRNQDLLEAEFKAVKEIADEYENKTFGVMLPQIISVSELKEAKRIASGVGFPKNVKFGIMVETPAAVQIINELCEEGIDFISFGTNDLTQYTLAIDRNNEEVQDLYDEMNPAVLSSVSYVIRRCKRYGVETSICGQAASRPEMAKFLVEQGIDSLSVNADAAYDVSMIVSEIESKGIVNSPENEEYHKKEEKKGYEYLVPPQKENIDEEELILQALGDLGDEYSPGLGKEKDIPPLNEAIPVSPEDFSKKEEVMEIPDFSPDSFENQPEEIFELEVMKEVQESEARQNFGPEKEWKKKGQNEALDIF